MCLINRWEMRGVFEKPLLLFSVLGHVSQKQLWSQVPEFNKTCDPSWFWETHPCLVRLKKLHFSLKIKTKEVLSLTYTHTLCVTRSKFYTDVNLVTICGRNANTYCSSDRRGLQCLFCRMLNTVCLLSFVCVMLCMGVQCVVSLCDALFVCSLFCSLLVA